VNRTREDRRRGRRSGYRMGSFYDNWADTSYDLMDAVVDIPARAWDAYRNEVDQDGADEPEPGPRTP
jgi:chloramphenicol 3-O-phosphotransferase